jgi:predicted nucleotidyltransferase
MNERTEILRKLAALRANLNAEFGISRIGVFGSVARGEVSVDSDVDLIVEFDSLRSADLFVLAALAETLKASLGREVDLVTSRSLSKRLRLKERIEREVLYVAGTAEIVTPQ